MFKIDKTYIVSKDSTKYLSFPDIIKSNISKDKLFMVYREGDCHHPIWSKLVLMVSNDNGETWELLKEFPRDLENNKCVWNCPRLSYIDDCLFIICDQKSGVIEKIAQFSTTLFLSYDDGNSWKTKDVPFPGMVPDKIIKFKENLFCANHKIKSTKNDLVQLVSWSRDNGKTWYDTNIIAHDPAKQFCEASIVNMGEYLIAYLRDNSDHQKNICTSISKNGNHWTVPEELPIFGQRVTALKDEDRSKSVIGAYRDTEYDPFKISLPKLKVCVFEHDLKNNTIKTSEIDWEYPNQQYHFGYTGLVRISPNKYIVVYYIKQNSSKPYIKLAFISKVK